MCLWYNHSMKLNNKEIIRAVSVLALISFAIAFFYFAKPKIDTNSNSANDAKATSLIQNDHDIPVDNIKDNDIVSLAQKLSDVKEPRYDDNNVDKALYKTAYTDASQNIFKYIKSHPHEVEKYIANNAAPTNTKMWESITSLYTLFIAFKMYPDDFPNLSNDKYKSVEEMFVDRSTSYDRSMADYNFDFYERPNGNYIIQADDLLNSGAYNISSYFYTMKLDKVKGHISINKINVINYHASGTLEMGNSADTSNYNYDTKSDMIISYGMKPFGMYPCNDNYYYEILDDRMILKKIMSVTACIGKDIGSPEDVYKYFNDKTDFSKMTLISSITDELYEKVKVININTLPKMELNY